MHHEPVARRQSHLLAERLDRINLVLVSSFLDRFSDRFGNSLFDCFLGGLRNSLFDCFRDNLFDCFGDGLFDNVGRDLLVYIARGNPVHNRIVYLAAGGSRGGEWIGDGGLLGHDRDDSLTTMTAVSRR